MIKKFNPAYLRKLCKTDCSVVMYQEGLSEEGEPLKSLDFKSKCRFVEKTSIVIDQDGKKVELVGLAVFVGDIAPGVKLISGGEVTINNVKYHIFAARRPRNPNGSVYHTTLELM